MSDCEGQGHKAVVYKSHFPTTKALHSHSVVTETPADTLANNPRLTKDQELCYSCPHDRNHNPIYAYFFMSTANRKQE